MSSRPVRIPAHPEPIAAPRDLAMVLRAAGFDVVLSVGRRDGAPLTDADRALLPQIIEGHEMGRELNPTDAELTQAVAHVLKTGTGGE